MYICVHDFHVGVFVCVCCGRVCVMSCLRICTFLYVVLFIMHVYVFVVRVVVRKKKHKNAHVICISYVVCIGCHILGWILRVGGINTSEAAGTWTHTTPSHQRKYYTSLLLFLVVCVPAPAACDILLNFISTSIFGERLLPYFNPCVVIICLQRFEFIS